jgi:putative glutamine amidotransferase
LLTGGPDVDPALYGQRRQAETDVTNALVDRFEIALTRTAVGRGLPLLAVCRGLQVLNVALGGTLHQHITDRPDGCDHGRPGVSAGRIAVDVAAGSRLAQVMGGTEAKTSCFHHQSVDRLGRGLRVTARAADGVVEGLELDEPPEPTRAGWLLAVQWHPETVADTEADQQAIFDAFVVAAAAAATATGSGREGMAGAAADDRSAGRSVGGPVVERS